MAHMAIWHIWLYGTYGYMPHMAVCCMAMAAIWLYDTYGCITMCAHMAVWHLASTSLCANCLSLGALPSPSSSDHCYLTHSCNMRGSTNGSVTMQTSQPYCSHLLFCTLASCSTSFSFFTLTSCRAARMAVSMALTSKLQRPLLTVATKVCVCSCV